MNSNCYCKYASNNEECETVQGARTNSKQKPLKRQHGLGIRWVLPGVVLVILPKCPICLAGYIAIGTGISLSIATATYLRISLIIISVVSLLYLLTKKLSALRYHKQ